MSRAGKVKVNIGVQGEHAGVRLDRLLRKLLPGVPLAGIHKTIREGRARRGDELLRASTRLVEGETLTLTLRAGDEVSLCERHAEPSRGNRGTCSAVGVPVLHEDGHVIAFDKPAGMASQPGSGHPLATTVLGGLYAIAGRGTAIARPALAGRLDRDASGVVLAGKTVEGVRGLSALVRARRIAKTYLALVKDSSLSERGRVDSPLIDAKRGRARMKVAGARDRGEALGAVTRYRIVSRGGGAALVEVTLETGRRHQIRAHMASLGAPLAGDVRYGESAWNRGLARRSGLARLFLHCAFAEFAHPVTGKTVRVRSPLPEGLARALDALGVKTPTKRRGRG